MTGGNDMMDWREGDKHMLSFTIEQQKCTRCGQCVQDCPVKIIAMDGGYPFIAVEKESSCFECQHCLAVCPTGAVSILGKKPENSVPLTGNLPAPEKVETLIKGRRSVRQYRDENVKPELIQRLLDVSCHAPTGVNSRQVLYTVVDDKEIMAELRRETMEGLARLLREGKLPPGRAYFNDCVRAWEEEGIDTIYRWAPHVIVASAPRDCPTPEADCMIALAYFELFAQSLGVGTVWNGLAKWTFTELVPELRSRLGIPENHLIGYVMAFGMPEVHYHRTVQREPARVARVSWK
jgi:nitroreductase/NAD-dependent dihydropyrimidine dehydrogenase PreA subunit